MIVNKATRISTLASDYWVAITIIFSVAIFIQLIDGYYHFEEYVIFSLGSVHIMLMALSIFLAFRFSDAYSRWWEGRKLWGQIVSSSRTFGRLVTTLLVPDLVGGIGDKNDANVLHRQLLNRHIAYINALRLELRQDTPMDVGEARWNELSAYLSPDELENIGNSANVPGSLLQYQARQLSINLTGSNSEQDILLKLNAILTQFQDAQTGCERIKNTPFPDVTSSIVRLFVWFAAIMIPVSVVSYDGLFSITDAVEVIFGACLALIFVFIEGLARTLEQPFAGSKHDLPITSLCRNIEIELLDVLGETDLPRRHEPVNGVLL
jgi:putative membrane protein